MHRKTNFLVNVYLDNKYFTSDSDSMQLQPESQPDLQLGPVLLGGSGGVVNSLDFCPASLKSLACLRTFFTMEGGEFYIAYFKNIFGGP